MLICHMGDEQWAIRGLWEKAIPALQEQSTSPGWSDMSVLCQALCTTHCHPAMPEEGKAPRVPYQAAGF